jgi:hypothetical protein
MAGKAVEWTLSEYAILTFNMQTPFPETETGFSPDQEATTAAAESREKAAAPDKPRPEPTRYGDWEKAGRCIDF